MELTIGKSDAANRGFAGGVTEGASDTVPYPYGITIESKIMPAHSADIEMRCMTSGSVSILIWETATLMAWACVLVFEGLRASLQWSMYTDCNSKSGRHMRARMRCAVNEKYILLSLGRC